MQLFKPVIYYNKKNIDLTIYLLFVKGILFEPLNS